MFEVTTCRVLVLDQLRPGSTYILAAALEGPHHEHYATGLAFSYAYAVVNLHSGDAEIHGVDTAERKVVFRTRGYEHRTLFVAASGPAKR